jgi:hypothetical protein
MAQANTPLTRQLHGGVEGHGAGQYPAKPLPTSDKLPHQHLPPSRYSHSHSLSPSQDGGVELGARRVETLTGERKYGKARVNRRRASSEDGDAELRVGRAGTCSG